jgi:hypothetical protein
VLLVDLIGGLIPLWLCDNSEELAKAVLCLEALRRGDDAKGVLFDRL